MMVAKGSIYHNRLGLLAGAIVLVWIVVFARFFVVAILEHQEFLGLAERQQVVSKEILPRRGEILDKNGEALATNVVKYYVSAVPKNIKDKEQFATTLAPLLGQTPESLLLLINNDKLYIPPLKRGLSEEEAERIGKLNLVGLVVVPESYRFYPEGELAAHLLGFVNAEGQGQYGLEGFYDEILQGFRGAVSFEKDPRGRPISFVEALAPARDGTGLILTLDRNLQYIVEQKLTASVEKFEADGGSVVVINAKTGEVMAMASHPAFPPGDFSAFGTTPQIFLNPVTQATWEPGSVIKPLAMAAAINEGVVTPETTETFGSSVVVDGWRINTAQNKAFGRETMTEVLENSDNVAMVWLTDKLGNEKFYRYLKEFGFDDKTNIDLMGEADPRILPLKEWRNINRATMSFGQGIAITPIQLVTAFAALGNGGKLVWPHLVKGFRTPDGTERFVEPKEIRTVILPETSDKIRAMLTSVVERGHGKKAKVPGFKVAGKTGTAQVPSPAGGYEEDKHVGSFCGFAPAEDPLFAMCVKFDTPRNVDWAESSAAPVFGEIASWILANYNIRPTE